MATEDKALILQQRLLIASQRKLIEELKAATAALMRGEALEDAAAQRLLENNAEDETEALLKELEKVKAGNPKIIRFLSVVKSR